MKRVRSGENASFKINRYSLIFSISFNVFIFVDKLLMAIKTLRERNEMREKIME